MSKHILGMLSGYCGVWVLHAGLQSGLVRVLSWQDGEALSEEKIITQSRCARRFVVVWLRAAYAFGLVGHSPRKGFFLAPCARGILAQPDGPHYLGAYISMYAQLSRVFSSVPLRMRDGKKVPLSFQDPALLEAMGEVTVNDFRRFMYPVISAQKDLHRKLIKGGVIVDIGAGSGASAIACARAYPRCRLIGIDADRRALEHARRKVAQGRLAERISLREMDARHISLGEKCALVYMNLSFHEVGNEPSDRLAFLKRCHAFLEDGGALLMHEMYFPDAIQRYRMPPMKMLLGMQLCEAVWGGGMMTVRQIESLLKQAGFRKRRVCADARAGRVVFLARR